MSNSYDLTQLDPNAFENMVNFLAMKVLGQGVAGFAPGSDGGEMDTLKVKQHIRVTKLGGLEFGIYSQSFINLI
ncbi:hypothetical protein C4J87_0193 [Pseudomonas sp. R1-43-08]|nr:hypothetical protein C4J87_0193 [Pseudomonas sp. R1-43-08]